MPQIHVVSVAASLILAVPDRVLENHSAASPTVVGEELARATHAWVRENRLGYYPALDFLHDAQALPDELVDAASNIAWLARELVKDEVRRRLRQVFSQVRIDALQSVAFTMPRVRPASPNALQGLAQHFTPDSVRVGLTVSMLRKQPVADGMEEYARRMLWRWLKDRFSAMEVTSSQVV
jgi:hypothetical protein